MECPRIATRAGVTVWLGRFKVAGVGFDEDREFDQAFQLDVGAFDVLGQEFVAEDLVVVLAPQ